MSDDLTGAGPCMCGGCRRCLADQGITDDDGSGRCGECEGGLPPWQKDGTLCPRCECELQTESEE